MKRHAAAVRSFPRSGAGEARKVMPCVVWSVQQAARHYGVSEITIRRRVRSGQLPAVQIGKSCRIPVDDVRFLRALPGVFTIHQIANLLDVSEVTVRRWIRTGDLPATKRGRSWMVSRRFIERLLEDVGVLPIGEERNAV